MYYIGVDLGTSALKTLLMDSEGAVLNIASREYPLEFPHPGWSQQKPEDWQKAVFACIPELTREIDRSKVAGIGVGGQMHGLVVLDQNDAVIRPAAPSVLGIRCGVRTEVSVRSAVIQASSDSTAWRP